MWLQVDLEMGDDPPSTFCKSRYSCHGKRMGSTIYRISGVKEHPGFTRFATPSIAEVKGGVLGLGIDLEKRTREH